MYVCMFVCLTYCAERKKRTLDLAKYSKVSNVRKGSPGVQGIQIQKTRGA